MPWDTIHDYINDPAGFDAHHRQWKAQEGEIKAEADHKTTWPWERHLCMLEAVADAARTVLAAARLQCIPGSEPPTVEELAMAWNRVSTAMLSLANALDVLDALDAEE